MQRAIVWGLYTCLGVSGASAQVQKVSLMGGIGHPVWRHDDFERTGYRLEDQPGTKAEITYSYDRPMGVGFSAGVQMAVYRYRFVEEGFSRLGVQGINESEARYRQFLFPLCIRFNFKTRKRDFGFALGPAFALGSISTAYTRSIAAYLEDSTGTTELKPTGSIRPDLQVAKALAFTANFDIQPIHSLRRLWIGADFNISFKYLGKVEGHTRFEREGKPYISTFNFRPRPAAAFLHLKYDLVRVGKRRTDQ